MNNKELKRLSDIFVDTFLNIKENVATLNRLYKSTNQDTDYFYRNISLSEDLYILGYDHNDNMIAVKKDITNLDVLKIYLGSSYIADIYTEKNKRYIYFKNDIFNEDEKVKIINLLLKRLENYSIYINNNIEEMKKVYKEELFKSLTILE